MPKKNIRYKKHEPNGYKPPATAKKLPQSNNVDIVHNVPKSVEKSKKVNPKQVFEKS